MIKEIIKAEFIKEIEELLSNKRQEIDKLSGIEKETAKLSHLDNFDKFVEQLNFKINKIAHKNKLFFKSQKEVNKFSAFMKPTFDKFYIEYAEISK